MFLHPFSILVSFLLVNPNRASQVALVVKNPPGKDLREAGLEEAMAPHPSILAWRIPWTEERDGLQSIGPQRVRQNWGDLTHMHTTPTSREMYEKQTVRKGGGTAYLQLRRWSPDSLATGIGFMEDNFSTDWGGGGMVSGWLKCVTFIVHFISIMIRSSPPQIIRH